MNQADTSHDEIFYFRRTKLLAFFAPVVALTGLSLMINPQSWRDSPLWVYGVFGALVLFLIYGCLVLPGSFYLQLTPAGFLIHNPLWPVHYPWKDIRNFRVVDGPALDFLGTGIRIVFDLADDSTHRTALSNAAASINHHDRSLLDMFTVSPEKLVATLNEWRELYGKMSPSAID
jgi:hypothetical protein